MKFLLAVVLAATAAWGQSASTGGWKGGGASTNSKGLADVYVAPNGSDDNPCTVDRPCQTPQHATTVLRGQPAGKHLAVFRGGYYFLKSPWTLDAGDGGTGTSTITYQNYPGEVAVISGGRLIAPGQPNVVGNWQRDATITCAGCDSGGAYYIDLDANPANAGHFANFEALFVDGARKPRTRLTGDSATYPYANDPRYSYVNGDNLACTDQTCANTNAADVLCGCPAGGIDVQGDGAARHCAALQTNLPTSGTNSYRCLNKLNYASTNVPTQPHGLGLGDVEVLTFAIWSMNRLRLQSASSGVATFTGPAMSGNGNTAAMDKYRFLVENISPKDTNPAPALKAGNWYLDRCPGCAYDATAPANTWRLYYLAAPGENPGSEEVIAPNLDPSNPYVLRMNGTAHVQFKGLSFAHDNFATDPRPWFPTTDYALNQWVTDWNGNQQKVTTAGTSGSAMPTWNSSGSGTTPDGTVVWTNQGVSPRYGLPDDQQIEIQTAAVHCMDCQNVLFDGVTIAHTQGIGLWYDVDGKVDLSSCSNSVAKACFQFVNAAVYDAGIMGITIGHPIHSPNKYAYPDTPASTPQNITIRNNVFAFMGQVEPGGFGGCAWLVGHDSLIEHNDCTDSYHEGFRMGDFLGREESDQAGYALIYNNWIQYNRIARIGKGVTSDFAGIKINTSFACLGQSGSCTPETSVLCPRFDSNAGPTLVPFNQYCNHIVNNVVTDVTHNWPDKNAPVYAYGGNGLYGDQGTTAVEWRNNVVARVSDTGIYINDAQKNHDIYATWNLAQNNIFVDNGSAQSNRAGDYSRAQALRRGKNPPHHFTFRNNIVSYDSSINRIQAMNGNWTCYDEGGVLADCNTRWVMDHNIYWNRKAGHVLEGAGGVAGRGFIRCTQNQAPPQPSCNNAGPYDSFSLTEYQELGEEMGSTGSANPQFTNYAADNFTPSAELNVYGFVPFEAAQAGRTNPILQAPNNNPEGFPTRPLASTEWGAGDQ